MEGQLPAMKQALSRSEGVACRYRVHLLTVTSQEPYAVSVAPIIQFVLFTIINCPPNFFWQQFLESAFPSHVQLAKKSVDGKPAHEAKLSIKNTLSKFLIDQTVGATVNTMLFSLVMAALQGYSWPEAVSRMRSEFWPMMLAGYKLWPVISIVNFGLVRNVQGRMLIGSMAGMVWNVWLSMMASGGSL
jgi:hypothetical protein